MRLRSPSASRSKATNDAGVCSASMRTREAAGWMRCCRRVEVEPVPVAVGHDDLAVDDAPLGERVEQHRDQLREVAVERALVAAGQLDLVAVAEHDAAEAVPLRLVQQAVSRSGSTVPAWPASAGSAASPGAAAPSRCRSVIRPSLPRGWGRSRRVAPDDRLAAEDPAAGRRSGAGRPAVRRPRSRRGRRAEAGHAPSQSSRSPAGAGGRRPIAPATSPAASRRRLGLAGARRRVLPNSPIRSTNDGCLGAHTRGPRRTASAACW